MVKHKDLTDKLRPWGRPQKIQTTNIYIRIEYEKAIEISTKEVEKAKTNKSQVESDPKSEKDLIQKVISATKINSKVLQPSIYKKVISEPIH